MSQPWTTNDDNSGGQPFPSISITIGTVDIKSDTDAKFRPGYAGPDNTGIYTDYKVSSRYEGDKHRYMMGITSPNGFKGKSVAFVQLAAPTLLWIADWTACRYQYQPDLPDPCLDDPNWILLDVQLEPYMLGIGADGITQLYRISGVYVYGNQQPGDDCAMNSPMVFPIAPWLQDVFDRTVPNAVFKKGIISSPTLMNRQPHPGFPGWPDQGGNLRQ